MPTRRSAWWDPNLRPSPLKVPLPGVVSALVREDEQDFVFTAVHLLEATCAQVRKLAAALQEKDEAVQRCLI